jgi:geranylgeranyl diphosphate synthase type II
MDFKEYLAAQKAVIDAALDKYLPAENLKPEIIHKAMRYSVFAGGKRLRPILVMAAAEAIGGIGSEVLPAACAMEMIHTYSLIHDDLPALDDDDYRRGRLTNHKVFGEAIAVLAGDALLTHAFNTLSLCSAAFALDRVNQVIAEISAAAGTFGMIGGQVADVEAEGKDITREDLDYIHSNKTGALFIASVRSGAILAGAGGEQLEALTAYGRHLGLAFQIRDDILDITGDSAKLGKTVGSDIRKKKATFPALYGLEESTMMAQEESRRALEIAEALGSLAQTLADLVHYLVSRDR